MSNQLQKLIKDIEKTYGENIIFSYDSESLSPIPSVSTGFPELDEITGVQGIPLGRVIEIFGPESGGKTTLALHIAANVQKMGKIVFYCDAEHSLDPTYATKIGVDVKSLLIHQPTTAEEALNIIIKLIQSEDIGLIIVDSVAGLIPQAELEGEIGDAYIANTARLMSSALRKICSLAAKNNIIVLFINQIREKMSMGYGFSLGGETTPGGKALKFYSSMRIRVSRNTSSTSYVRKNGEIIGHKITFKIVKNKVAPPFKEAEAVLYYDGSTIERIIKCIDAAINENIVNYVTKTNIEYKADNGLVYRQNYKKFIKLLEENNDLFEEIKSKINKTVLEDENLNEDENLDENLDESLYEN